MRRRHQPINPCPSSPERRRAQSRLSTFFVVVALAGCGRAEPTLAHGKPTAHWLQTLSGPDAKTRRKAAEVLGNVGAADAGTVPALARALTDADAGVRRQAALALFQIGPPAREALPALAEAQSDPDERVRDAAAKAAARVGGR